MYLGLRLSRQRILLLPGAGLAASGMSQAAAVQAAIEPARALLAVAAVQKQRLR